MSKTITFPLALAAVLLAAGAAAADKSIPVPGSWIVELESPPTLDYRGGASALERVDGEEKTRTLAATAPDAIGKRRFDARSPQVRAYVDHLADERRNLLTAAEDALGRSIEPKAVYRHVMNGFAAELSAAEAARLADMPGVASVRQERAWRKHLDEGPDLIGADVMWAGFGDESTRGEGIVIGIIDSGINWDHRYFSDSPGDTGGYDFENPLGSQLGECTSASVPCNDKLVGVWDFADEGTDGKDPDGEGHGTHVASTAAGNAWAFSLQNIPGKTFRTSGVAPRANIVSYKVCYDEHPTNSDLDGRCGSSELLEGLDQAVEDGVDVVNYSIGGDPIDPWDPDNDIAQRVLNLRSAGIVFVSSAGNSGPGVGTISSPANAPWAMSVAASSHRRRIGREAEVASVSDIFVIPGSGPNWSEDISGPVIPAEVAGEDLFGCDAYPGGALDGAIALVSRGECTFEAKVSNADAAGAIAVLVYNNVPGLPITMGGLEGTAIPAAMMDRDNGQAALAAIDGDSTATLFGESAAFVNSDWEDIVAPFGSRGPGVGAPGVLKPNLSAPGVEIIGGSVPDSNSLAVLSGTSMASPHIAGAAALLKSRHSDWTPEIIQSALETTAVTEPMTFNEGPATALDRGNGRARVHRAADIGLYLPVSTSDFENANPASGGNPSALNLAGMYSEDCVDGCQFERTVRALESGSWDVAVEGDFDVTVSPDSFSLSSGQQQQLTIEVAPGQLPLNKVSESTVVLEPTGDFSTQRLTVAVRRDAEIAAAANRGRETMASPVAGAMPEATFRTSALVQPEREDFDLAVDNTDNPYSGFQGRRTFLVDAGEDALALKADIVASSAEDIDLFVGRDENGDGRADESEEQCASTSADEIESCEILAPEPGQWWILVQNWPHPSDSGEDSVSLEHAVLDAADDPSLVATGPGTHAGGPLEVDLFWDQPAMREGETWLGAVGFGSTPDQLADLGVVPVRVRREQPETVEPVPLFAGETRAVIVPGGATHDRVYIDVPPGTDQMDVAVFGDSGVDAELRRIDFDDTAAQVPGTPAPSGGTVESGSGSGDGIGFSLQQPDEGRWYVVLDNTNASEALVDVTVNFAAATSLGSQRGLWSPRDRDIFQGIEWQESGGTDFIVWYAYDAEGLPVFYNAIADSDPDSSVWQADILRTTSIGVRNNTNLVGRMQITHLGDDEMMVAWRLKGRSGAERFTPDVTPTCPTVDGQPASYTGHWFPPDVAEGGTTMIVTESSQAQVRYYFDDLGIGRWVITSDEAGSGPMAEQLDVLELRGFCASCEEQEVTVETVGSYARMFDDEESGTEVVEFDSRAPLDQTFESDRPIIKLSARQDCQ